MKKEFKKLNIIFFLIISLFIAFACNKKNVVKVNQERIQIEETQKEQLEFTFRTEYLKKEHFEKHGEETNCKTADEYEEKANQVIKDKNALIKEEKEDGDYIYYIVDTNEIVFLSKDGYIRSYFKPSKGKKYFDKQ